MESAEIHPLSLVEPGAKIGRGVKIGPFCHVGPDAILGDGVELLSHVSIRGATELGAGCIVYPQAVLGALPQNTGHKGGRTTLTIGTNCIIREGVTMHVGTDTSRGRTDVGNNGHFLANSHVGHDCIVGNNVTFANNASLGGHVEVGDYVTIGGLSAVHQFSRIGHHAFIAGLTGVTGDVIPYAMASGARSRLHGLNIIGMKRAGLSREEIHAARAAYSALFEAPTPFAENLAAFSQKSDQSRAVASIIEFLHARGKRPLVSASGRGHLEEHGDDAG